MSDLHVIHVIDSLGRGGAERQVVQLGRYLATRQIKQTVIQLFKDDSLAPALEASGVRCIRLGFEQRTASAPMIFPALMYTLSTARPSIIATQLVTSDILGRLAAKACDVPVVSTWQNTTYAAHAPLMANPRTAIQMRVFRQLDRLTTKYAHRFVAVSKTVKDSYMQALSVPSESIVVIPNSIDTARFERPVQARCSDGIIRLVHVGRLVAQKGLDTLIEAVAQLPRRLRFEIHQFGAGPLEHELRANARKRGVSDRIFFHGPVSDVVDQLRRADAFVFPSLHEGLALALLEAYGAGLPVVATDIGPNREVDPAARATLFIAPSNPTFLAEALQRIIEDDALRNRLRENATSVIEPFRIERVGAQFHDLLVDGVASQST